MLNLPNILEIVDNLSSMFVFHMKKAYKKIEIPAKVAFYMKKECI